MPTNKYNQTSYDQMQSAMDRALLKWTIRQTPVAPLSGGITHRGQSVMSFGYGYDRKGKIVDYQMLAKLVNDPKYAEVAHTIVGKLHRYKIHTFWRGLDTVDTSFGLPSTTSPEIFSTTVVLMLNGGHEEEVAQLRSRTEQEALVNHDVLRLKFSNKL